MRRTLTLLAVVALVLTMAISAYGVNVDTLNTQQLIYSLGDTVEVYGVTLYTTSETHISINESGVYFTTISGPVDVVEVSVPVSLVVPIINNGSEDVVVTGVMTVYSAGVPVTTTFGFTTVPAGSEGTIGLGWTPSEPGVYTIEVYVVANVSSLVPLTSEYLVLQVETGGPITIEKKSPSGVIVMLKLISPEDKLIAVSGAEVMSDGSFSRTLLKIPEAPGVLPEGEYTIEATMPSGVRLETKFAIYSGPSTITVTETVVETTTETTTQHITETVTVTVPKTETRVVTLERTITETEVETLTKTLTETSTTTAFKTVERTRTETNTVTTTRTVRSTSTTTLVTTVTEEVEVVPTWIYGIVVFAVIGVLAAAVIAARRG